MYHRRLLFSKNSDKPKKTFQVPKWRDVPLHRHGDTPHSLALFDFAHCIARRTDSHYLVAPLLPKLPQQPPAEGVQRPRDGGRADEFNCRHLMNCIFGNSLRPSLRYRNRWLFENIFWPQTDKIHDSHQDKIFL